MQVPLTLQYPNTPSSTTFYADPKSAPKFDFGGHSKTGSVRVRTLPNGVRLATDTTPASTIAAGIYVETGTIYETDENHGICHFLERVAFKSTENLTASELVQTLEHTGGNITASSSKEAMFYNLEMTGEHVELGFKTLSNLVLHPKFSTDEVDEEREFIKSEILESEHNLAVQIPDYSQSVAFGTSPLGRRLMPDMEVLKSLGEKQLFDFHSRFYRPNRMIVSVVGMDHEAAEHLVQRHFQIPQRILDLGPCNEVYPESEYVGGEARLFVDDSFPPEAREFAHYNLTFKGFGNVDTDENLKLYVLQSLFGGGGSFSAGGPGKGMYTRFYRNVVCSHANVENLETSNNPFLHTGLFSINVSCVHGMIGEGISLICQELADAALGMSDEEFLRAKNQLKGAYFGSLESQGVLCDDLARQVLELGDKRLTPQLVCEKLDSLKKAELQEFLTEILTRASPTVVYAAQQHEVEIAPEVSQIWDYFKESLGKK